MMAKAEFPPVPKVVRWLPLPGVALVAALCPMTSLAFDVHYSDERNASLQACDESRHGGEMDAARACYASLYDKATTDPLTRADAARALGRQPEANRLYRELAARDDDADVLSNWAELYLDSHQTSDAMSLYREALEINPDHLPARIGLAVARSQTFQGQAREDLQAIVAEHPESLRATIELARIELELQHLDVAAGLLDKAEAMADERGEPMLELHGLRAGHALLSGRSMEPFFTKAAAENPHFGEVYSIAAHHYIITYRYREAIDLYRRAVAAEPDHAPAHRDLGVNLLRVNRLFDARHHLERAFDLDPYDVLTINSLRLLDSIDDMRVLRFDVSGESAPDDILARVTVRLDRDEADALAPYVVDLTTRAVRTFTKVFDFRLERPMVIELYDDHDDFGVRTVSTPGIGLLGVTFGYLTAMDSPRARPNGDFHWATTLWHEIAHVFTLEASEHRLPRWMGEGLSVHEEWRTGPLPSRELPLEVIAMWQEGKFLPVEDLDQGFVRPNYPGQVQVSYMQAGLIVDFMAERFGRESLVAFMRGYTEGRNTAENFRDILDMTPAEFDELFNDHMALRYGKLAERLPRYQGESRFLERLVQDEDWQTALSMAESLVREYPARVGPGNAWLPLARARRALGDEEAAIETELAWLRAGGHDPEVLMDMAERFRDAGRDDDAVEVLEALNWVMPYSSSDHNWLGMQYLDRGDADRARREFDAALGSRHPDRAPALHGKAEAARLDGQNDKARRLVLQALEVAPFHRPAQQLLLKLVEGDTNE